ncbi:hypothetical protein O6H91_20G043100 [Diphasiastrum complanatum]|uniref:Uncharacterized protein n=1 Tax=Diphasiastrum complanatum TaxID=34168 RepID=A0ACC2APQ0_DIPCM|nr:hypothetical protein O6H91_20G043100 [Diphasiastrum complanatum]
MVITGYPSSWRIAVISICTIMIADALTPQVGINYGRVADNLPSPDKVVSLIKNLQIGFVKIYDANSQVLNALANSGLQVSVMVSNDQISSIASSQTNSDNWVEKNIVPYYPATQITTLAVGNEVLSDTSIKSVWAQLVPAMENIHSSLVRKNLNKIQVTSPVASDALGNSYPPSSGKFRDDIATSIIKPMLSFLSRTNSAFFANIYPYFAWANNPQQISLEYAIFGSSSAVVTDGSTQYTSLLDAMLDATIVAMKNLGYGDVDIVISETGWPTQGGTGANVKNAALYNKRMVGRATAGVGTPLRPNSAIPTFIFALFNEDQKPGAATEHNWGVLYPNGSPVYALDFTGQRSSVSVLIQKQWCVVKSDVTDGQLLQRGLDYACGTGNVGDCEAIQPGASCYDPNTLSAHASYAFNSYWQQQKASGGTCDFGGAAKLTTVDPSHDSCTFPFQ